MITKEDAIEIAKHKCDGRFEFYGIIHGIPNNCRIYNSGEWFPDDVWCILCSAHPGKCMLASSRAIVVSKDTGTVLYDGSANDEG
ncbi:MAG: hypothetical protein KKH94_07215 [Candidatus Omnitrophica bacterium]|nr:hypothetical protein [Candidatus Omnitrophota bacterium]